MIINILKSKLFKNSAVYGLTNALYTGLPLILMPFLITILQPEDYGIIELFRSFSLVTIPVIGLSTLASVDRFYFESTENEYNKLISSIILFHFFNGLIICVFLYSLKSFLPEKYYIIIFLSIVYSVFNQITEIYLTVLRVKEKATSFLKLRITSVILDLLLLLLFYFVYQNYDWTYRIYPNVISTVIVGLLVFIIIFYKYKICLRIDKEQLKKALIFSAPLILHMISGYILNLSNRFFILHYHDEKVLGNFSLAYQIGMMVSFFYTSFNMAWVPIFYNYLEKNQNNNINTIRKIVFGCLIILSLLFFGGWMFFYKYFESLNKYTISSLTIIILLFSFVIFSFYKFEGNYFFYYKKTGLLSIFTLISCIIAVILNFLLIPKYDVLGAAISSFMSYLFLYLSVLINKSRIIEGDRSI